MGRIVLPSYDDMILAADWLEAVEGEEGRPCRRVARWLRFQSRERAIRYIARQRRVSVPFVRRVLEKRRGL